MSKTLTLKIRKALTIILLLILPLAANNVCAQEDGVHEFTVYVMPTLLPLNWESPSTLFNSMKTCYLKTITQADNYLLGHVAVSMNSPLLEKPLLIAQTSGTLDEKLNLIFKQKVGFGIIGAPLQGRLESEEELKHKLNVYSKRNKLAFIRYRISEKAARRMLTFIDNYSKKMNDKNAPCDFYGGAFWPRYHKEGSGCSGFGMVLLEVVNMLNKDSEDWKLVVNIPMSIIGGEFNQNKKIKNSTIKKTHRWAAENGRPNVDYVKYMVYEPSLMFDWILNKRAQSDSVYIPISENGIPGLIVDNRHIEVNEEEPLFIERTEQNLFIDYYLRKINSSNQ